MSLIQGSKTPNSLRKQVFPNSFGGKIDADLKSAGRTPWRDGGRFPVLVQKLSLRRSPPPPHAASEAAHPPHPHRGGQQSLAPVCTVRGKSRGYRASGTYSETAKSRLVPFGREGSFGAVISTHNICCNGPASFPATYNFSLKQKTEKKYTQ